MSKPDEPASGRSDEVEPFPEGDVKVPFRISAGLKRIIGRDLITNEFVAIFELVKNSFDARAPNVHIVFREDQILIIDDGKGMNRRGLLDRWLFVAYSAKKDGTEDEDEDGRLGVPEGTPILDEPALARRAPDVQAGDGYRSRVQARRAYAGNKGVGRFSCDRLGRYLKLQTRFVGEIGVEELSVDWARFERDPRENFLEVKVDLSSKPGFDIPEGPWPQSLTHGTVLNITGLHEADQWDRTKLLRLRAGLAKLINPFEEANEDFSVRLHAPAELPKDRDVAGVSKLTDSAIDEGNYPKIVNGPIRNFVLNLLKEKTTFVDVRISEDKKSFESKLIDRGEAVYEISEPSEAFPLLASSGFKCQLFYLNRSAKKTFASRMGLASKNFGSVFLYNNGFRVYPVGEPADDTFGIDARKAQAYARNLGNREIIGRIDVFSTGDDFKESTSRDQGLIRTPAYEQLTQCFMQLCFRRLERYVVDVTWADKEDKDRDTIAGIAGDEGSARATELVSKLVRNSAVEIVHASPNLIRIVDEKAQDFGANIKAFRVVANKLGDRNLLKRARLAEERFAEAKRLEVAEREAREREQAARKLAEERAAEAKEAARQAAEAAAREAVARVDAEKTSARLESAYAEEKKRNLFLTSLASVDEEALQDMLHIVGIDAQALARIMTAKLSRLQASRRVTKEEWMTFLEKALVLAQRIQVVSQVTTRAQFRLKSETVKADLAGYIRQYCEEICTLYTGDRMDVSVEDRSDGFEHRFRPIEIGMMLDNLVSNSRKAGAKSFAVEMDEIKGSLVISVEDDGRGIPDILEPGRVFEKGFSTTHGSGLGLYHVSRTLTELGGAIEVGGNSVRGAKFMITIKGEGRS